MRHHNHQAWQEWEGRRGDGGGGGGGGGGEEEVEEREEWSREGNWKGERRSRGRGGALRKENHLETLQMREN